MYTRRKCRPRLGSVACLGDQSRVSWQVITGRCSTEPAKQNDGSPHNRNDHRRCSHVLLCTTGRTSRAAMLQQQPRFKLFILWWHRTVLLRVCIGVRSCAFGYNRVWDRMLGIGNTNVLRTAVQLHLCIFFCFDLLSAAAVLV